MLYDFDEGHTCLTTTLFLIIFVLGDGYLDKDFIHMTSVFHHFHAIVRDVVPEIPVAAQVVSSCEHYVAAYPQE